MRWALLLGLLAASVSACGGGNGRVAERSAHPAATKALHFGALPREGIVVETERLGRPTLTFVGLGGHVYGRLKIGLDADSQLLRGVVVVRNPRTGKRFVFDAPRSQLEAYEGRSHYMPLTSRATGPRSCGTFALRGRERFLLCPASRRDAAEPISIEVASVGRRRRIAGPPPHSRPPPDHIGSWEKAYLSPDGKTVLALWSVECEVPTTFFASRNGRLRAVTGERDWRKAPESVPLGWSRKGMAVVQLFEAVCGYGYERPGVYLLDPQTGAHRLVYDTARSFAVMWSD